jgi:hypothetical protein
MVDLGDALPLNLGDDDEAKLQNAADAPEPDNARLLQIENEYAQQVAAFRATLTDANKALFDELQIINGQDAYSATAAALGRLPANRYLALPDGTPLPAVRAVDVGTNRAKNVFPPAYLAQVYALNKLRAPDGVDPMRFAAIRVQAVAAGWATGDYETVFVPPLATANATYSADLIAMKDAWATAKAAAFLIPMISEHVFRNYGHHYLSTDAANYNERYKKTLIACMATNIVGYLPPEALYYSALHWISPARARAVIKAQLLSDAIPEAIRLRFHSAPAGYALVTTTSAVIDAMRSANIAGAIAEEGHFDLEAIQVAAKKVKMNSTRFHKTPQAYRTAPAPLAEVKSVEDAKLEAARFAPIAQGFIDAYLVGSPLGNAKALAKYADSNPVLKRRATQFFRDLTRNRALTVTTLFASVVAARPAAGE